MEESNNNNLNLDHLDVTERVLILQGLSLIEDGINLIEWMDSKVNENSTDAFTLLKDRFNNLQECVFSGKHFATLAKDNLSNKIDGLPIIEEDKSQIKKQILNLKFLNKDVKK